MPFIHVITTPHSQLFPFSLFSTFPLDSDREEFSTSESFAHCHLLCLTCQVGDFSIGSDEKDAIISMSLFFSHLHSLLYLLQGTKRRLSLSLFVLALLNQPIQSISMTNRGREIREREGGCLGMTRSVHTGVSSLNLSHGLFDLFQSTSLFVPSHSNLYSSFLLLNLPFLPSFPLLLPILFYCYRTSTLRVVKLVVKRIENYCDIVDLPFPPSSLLPPLSLFFPHSIFTFICISFSHPFLSQKRDR